jgi:nucleotide-binding universal stress UspA family protein
MQSDYRVLAAIDVSDGADEVLSQWSAIAARPMVQSAVVHVIPRIEEIAILFPRAHDENAIQLDGIAARAREDVRARVESVAQREVEIFIDEGQSYAEIVKRAESWQADLVIVGGHGQSGIARVFGTVAERVVRYAHCPVLVARSGKGHGGVLAGTDLSPPSLRAVMAGGEEARSRGTLLKVVHAVGFLELEAAYLIGRATPGMSRDVGYAAFARALESAVEELHVTATCEILEGSPAAAILRVATSLDAELVVVGSHGKTGLARIALGSVAEKVARNAHCSVLVVR